MFAQLGDIQFDLITYFDGINDTITYNYAEHERINNKTLLQFLELDSKRIRAICEPSIKDELTGETWLDYYNNQVAVLREELKNL